MELLKECQKLYDELTLLKKDLNYIDERLTKDKEISFEEFESLYGEEFRIAMLMMGCVEDLMMKLDELQEYEGMQFIANRLRTNATALVVTKGIDVV